VGEWKLWVHLGPWAPWASLGEVAEALIDD
jgi:hypothetical protein